MSEKAVQPFMQFGPVTGAVIASSLIVFSTVFAPAARAAALVWSGATDSNWATTTNWTPNGTPGTGDTVTFGATNNGHTTIGLGSGVSINALQFDTPVSYTIGAGAVGAETLRLDHGGSISIASAIVQNNQLINAGVVLGPNALTGTYTLTSGRSGAVLTLAGPISGGTGGTAGAKTLAIGGAGDTTISGVIGGGGGAISVTHTVGGTLTLSGTNTFTGTLTLTGGFVSVPVINNASTAGPLGNSANAVTFGTRLTYTGSTASSTKKFALTGQYPTFYIFSAATELTLSGVISGATSGGGFIKDGPGTMTLSGVNTYTGGTIVSVGTLKLFGSGTLGASSGPLAVGAGILDLNGTSQTVGGLAGGGTIVNDGGGASTLTVNNTTSTNPFSGTIADHDNATTGTIAFTKGGTSSLALSGNNSYSGATTVNGGLLVAASANALGNTSGITVNSGGSLRINQDLGAVPMTIAGAGSSGEAGAFENIGTATYSGLLKLGANATVAAQYSSGGSSLALTNPGIITGSGFTLTLVAPYGTGSIAGVIGTGTGGVTINGPLGKWTLTGANTFSGALSVLDFATLAVPTVNNASTAGPLGNSAAAVTLNQGILEYTGATASSTKKFTLATSGTFQIDTAATELTLSGVIANDLVAGGDALTKIGPGTLTLSGVNTYSGGTTVSEGTLKLSGSGTLGAITGDLSVDSTLDLNGTSQTVAGFGGGGTVTNNGGGTSILTATQPSATLGQFDGTIVDNTNSTAGTVAFTKAGAGALVLSGANTYSGATTVSAGMLALDNNNALGSTTGGTTVSSGATLQFYSGLDIPAEPITISGTGAAGYGGALFLAGGGSYAGLLKLGANATIISNASTFNFTNTGTITGAGFTLTLAGVGGNSIASIIGTTTGGLTVTGGTWSLTGANTYTGLTTISGGILNIQNANALGGTTNGTTVASGATLQVQGGITVGAEPLTISGTGAGTGALENVSDTNSFGGLIKLGTGGATISSDAGTLNLTNAGTIFGTATGLPFTLTGAGDGSLASIWNGGISGTAGAGTLTKSGAGKWTLSGANTYTGATTINAGVLDVKSVTGLGAIAGGVSVVSGATLQIEGGIAIGAEALTLRGTGASSATGALENVSGTNSYAGLVTLGAASTISSDSGTLSLTNAGTITGPTFSLTLTGSGNGSIASIIGTTSGGVTKTGQGTWTLSGANTFTGTLSVLGGTLAVPTFNNASASGPFGNSASAVVLDGGGAIVLEYTGTTASSNKPFTFMNSGIDYGAVGFQIDTAGTNLTLSGTIAGGNNVFSKYGPGTLTLTGANGFFAEVNVSQGTLVAAAAGAIGSSSPFGILIRPSATLQVAGAGSIDRIGDSVPLTLDGGTFSTAGLSNASETLGSFSLITANSTIDFGSGSGDDLIFSGVGTHDAGIKLAITNWNGTLLTLGTATSDRLIFNGVSSAFTSVYSQADVTFNSVAGYVTIQYDANHYEVVAPEPDSLSILGAALLGLASFRRPRKNAGR